MMKTIFLFLIPLSLFAADKEYASGSLVEMDTSGHEITPWNSRIITLFASKNRKPSVIQLSEVLGPPPCPTGKMCPLMPSVLRTSKFTVTAQRGMGCGSRLSLARDGKRRLAFIDHTNRTCDDYKKYLWEITLVESDNSRRHLFGGPDPKPVAENCHEKLRELLCTAEYAPTHCRASSLDQGKTELSPALEADGSNQCHAQYMIKLMACDKGIDPDHLSVEDFACKMASPDPSVK